MSLRQLFGRYLGGAAADSGVPNFYPDLQPLQLEQFLTQAEFLRIKAFENVYILPFVSEKSEVWQKCFGVGLSRLMIRDAMLLRDVSIHGPEDTPLAPYESLEEVTSKDKKSSYVCGVVDFDERGLSLHLELHRPGQQITKVRVQNRDFALFLEECAMAIARALGSRVDDATCAAWKVAQPTDPELLVEMGRIILSFPRDQIAERGRAALELLAEHPDFVMALWEIDEELSYAREKYLEGLKRDPFNAQLFFLLFCIVWESKKPQPEAMQLCRKAIELSPGHGKAHMCAPHAAQNPVAMLNHSELGYRLLPGNSFAVNNYVIALDRAKAPAKRRFALAREIMANDPHDPSSYQHLIEIYEEAGKIDRALAGAEALQKLLEPTIHERTLYCLRQNPRVARQIDAGEYDLAAKNRQCIERLRALLSLQQNAS